MAILAGAARRFSRRPPERGRVILLFQPAEERGEGAARVLEDPRFSTLKPDWVFALHNLPGFERGTVITNSGVFSAASVGMEIKLFGKTSHAGEPEQGINPARAVSRLIGDFETVSRGDEFQSTVFITVVHILLGEIAYGTSAGYGELRITMRAFENPDMDKIKKTVCQRVGQTCMKEGLRCETRFVEDFPAVHNDPGANRRVEETAREAGLKVIRREEPFRWSEDFSRFLVQTPGALFGLGAGGNHPQLHHPDYDFPDDLIPPGVEVMVRLARSLIGGKGRPE